MGHKVYPRRSEMISLSGFAISSCGRKLRQFFRILTLSILPLLMLTMSLANPRIASAQSVESADAGRALLSVGVAASGFTLQYGDRKIFGIAAWVGATVGLRYRIF